MSLKNSFSAGFAKRSISVSLTYSAGFSNHQSPQLSYRNSNHVVEFFSAKRLFFLPSSPIASLNGLNAALLAACNEAKKDLDKYGSELDQAFLKENLMSDPHDHAHEVSAMEIDEVSKVSEADVAFEASENNEASEVDKAFASVSLQKTLGLTTNAINAQNQNCSWFLMVRLKYPRNAGK